MKLVCISSTCAHMDQIIDRALDSRYLQEVVKAASGKPYDEKIAGMCHTLFSCIALTL